MSSNLSLKTTVLFAAILISGVLVPYTVFASPIFETDTAETTNSFFETEQSITNPLYYTSVTPPFNSARISNLDVVVSDTPTGTEAFIIFQDSYDAPLNNVVLTYTNSSITNGTSTNSFFVDTINYTRTVILNENGFDVPANRADGTGGPIVNIPPPNLCNTASSPKIAVTDSHVFVAWIDQRLNGICSYAGGTENRIATIAIPKSNFDDRTTAFFNPFTVTGGTPPAYYDTGSITLGFSIAANGTTAYIAWEDQDDTSVNLIPFDGAAYVATTGDFGTNINFGVSTSTPLNPDVVADGTNVYVAWQNATAGDKNIKLATSSNSGVTFGTPVSISGTNSVASTAPKLAEDDGKVHVSWREFISATNQRIFAASSGNSYSPVDVSANSGTATGQQIIADGANVFSVWQEANIGNQQINEVLFSRSTDSGVSFDTPIDLSDSSGNSQIPQISGNSTHVNVVWRDNTFLPSSTGVDGQVWFKSSSDSGASFDGLQVISESTNSTSNSFGGSINPKPIPNISSFGGVVVAVWSPDPLFSNPSWNGGTSDKWVGSMKAALTSKIDISFNSTEYLKPRNATITVVDTSPGVIGTGDVKIDLQRRDGSFIEYTLVEEGSTGTFSNTFELYSGISNLDGAPGDIFTANYTVSGTTWITTQAKIQETRTLDFLTALNATGAYTHDIGDIVGLQLNDTDSNTSATTVDTIVATITSDADSEGTTITLTETEINSSIFNVTNGLIFMNGTLTPSIDDELTITKTKDPLTAITDDDVIETIDQKITTTTNPTGVTITLIETDADTNVYTAEFTICDSSDDDECISPDISGAGGDFITISNTDETQASNGIILFDDDDDNDAFTTRAAILVSCGSISCGTVTATYGSLDVSIGVLDTLASGGGGGGVSRAGLVVNALAGVSSLSSSGGGADGSAPIVSLGNLISNKNFDVPDEIVKIIENSDPTTPLAPIPTSTFADFDLPLTINDNGYPLGDYSNTIQTFSTDIGEPMTITSLYYEQTALQHVSMYMNLRGDTTGELSRSDTQILYNKDKSLQVIDPNGFFEKVSVNIIEDEDTIKKFAEFEIIFAKPMETSDIVFRSWDDRLRSMDTIIFDAIEIIDPQTIVQTINPEPVEDIIEPVAEVQKVPEGMKNISKWWAQGEVDDTKFKEVIQFLVQEEIIDVPTELNVSVSKDDELAEEESDVYAEPTIQIPEWIKNNAEWWSLGVISEDDFLKSVEYLVKNEIIQI